MPAARKRFSTNRLTFSTTLIAAANPSSAAVNRDIPYPCFDGITRRPVRQFLASQKNAARISFHKAIDTLTDFLFTRTDKSHQTDNFPLFDCKIERFKRALFTEVLDVQDLFCSRIGLFSLQIAIGRKGMPLPLAARSPQYWRRRPPFRSHFCHLLKSRSDRNFL